MSKKKKKSTAKSLLPKKKIEAAKSMQIVNSQETWTEFTLEDGHTIRMKPVIIDVTHTKGQVDANGNNKYDIKAAMIIDVKKPR